MAVQSDFIITESLAEVFPLPPSRCGMQKRCCFLAASSIKNLNLAFGGLEFGTENFLWPANWNKISLLESDIFEQKIYRTIYGALFKR